MDITVWLVFLVIAAFLALLLKGQRPELSLGLSIAAGIIVMTAVVAAGMPLFSAVRDMFSAAGIRSAYLTAAVKGLGVCLTTQLAADACKDAGENGLAAKAELAGKVVLLLLTLPLFQDIQTLIITLLKP